MHQLFVHDFLLISTTTTTTLSTQALHVTYTGLLRGLSTVRTHGAHELFFSLASSLDWVHAGNLGSCDKQQLVDCATTDPADGWR